MNADGTGQTRLTNTSDSAESQPTWTPDGKKITFVRWAGCLSNFCSYLLYTINADGTGEAYQPNDAGNFGPAWSPNGSRLAYVRYNLGSNTGADCTIKTD